MSRKSANPVRQTFDWGNRWNGGWSEIERSQTTTDTIAVVAARNEPARPEMPMEPADQEQLTERSLAQAKPPGVPAER